MNNETPKISEGEEYILDFLKEERIRFEREKKIPGLLGDGPSYRIADFYLPDYKIYLEFFGQWNHGEEHKERYRLKKKAYFNNSIPCIYVYPENLGILDFIFKKRIVYILKKHNQNRELLRWRLIRSLKENNDNLWAFELSLGLLIYTIIPPVNEDHILIFIAITLFFLLRILYRSFKIFTS